MLMYPYSGYRIYISFILISMFINILNSEKITYLSTERPFVWYNKKFVEYANLTALRHGRQSPYYYVNFTAVCLITLDNNVRVDYNIHQFLTNRYHPTFVDLHFKFCDMLEKDTFLGEYLKTGGLKGSCPFPAGVYQLRNMVLPHGVIPAAFPFTKGRVITNVTYLPTNECMGWGHMDIELKQISTGKRKSGKS